ncbi:MAG: DUF2157 domain-containing protein [Bacteroidetes bacterium]|nr:DUF2157 domain-containing protein [Bacteroidota bacterium]
MNTSALLNFLNSLERNGILNAVANQKIQEFLDFNTKSVGKLFLALAATIGALFVSAGIFAIISHNWDDFPKHVRGVLSFVPSLVALYVYYVAVFKFPKSTSWIEASSLFLMLMIGASIALVSQTYQMDGDFDKFLFIWLMLTIPLFYIARASGIALFYLVLACKFLYPDVHWTFFIPTGYSFNEKYYLFWLFLFAFLPHFYLSLNRQSTRQGFRVIYLGWVVTIVLLIALPLAIKAGYLWWGVALVMLYYLIGKKYYRDNVSALGRPFQTIALITVFINLLYFSDDLINELAFKIDRIEEIGTWNAEQIAFFSAGVIAVIALTILALKWKKKEMPLNRYMIFTPFLFVFLYGIYCLNEFADFDIEWLGYLVLNFYALGFGINAMIQGNKSWNVFYMVFGLFQVCFLLWMRYFDMDLPFWLKGIFFIGVGFMFFLIHYLSKDDFEE